MFDVENPHTPADCGIKSRTLTSTPRERRAPQTHNEATDLNEAHHKPRGNASYNPDESITNKHVQGRFVPPKVGNMPTQQQQSSSEEGSKENTILNGPRNERGSAQGHPSSSADTMPQGPAPTAPTTQTGGPPQAPPINIQNRDHQDPPEHNDTTNGSTRAPANGKGPGATKAKKRASEHCPGTVASTGPANQPSDSSKNTIICSRCGESGHWSRNCPYYNFCDFCRVTTHSIHMCRATKHGPRSPVCKYCGKTNHSSAYCRYRSRDNREEPRNTPDALKTGATGKILALAARNQTGPTHCNTNKTPFSHIDGRGQNQPNGGLHRPQHREKIVLLPEVNKWIIILFFLLGDSNTLTLMRATTRDIFPLLFLHLDLTTH